MRSREVNEDILPYFTTALLQNKDELFPHGSSESYKLCKRKRAPTLINSFVESISTAQKTYLQQLDRAKTEFVSNLAGAIHMDKLLADEDGSTEEDSSTDDSSISDEENQTLKDGLFATDAHSQSAKQKLTGCLVTCILNTLQ